MAKKGAITPQVQGRSWPSAGFNWPSCSLCEQYPEERTEALGHLDFAIAEFRDMKMQPPLSAPSAINRSSRRREVDYQVKGISFGF